MGTTAAMAPSDAPQTNANDVPIDIAMENARDHGDEFGGVSQCESCRHASSTHYCCGALAASKTSVENLSHARTCG